MTSAAVAWHGGWRQGLGYGALGLPLAFVALPLYVVLPSHYAREFGVALPTLGALLLGARLFDAAVDPWIGRLVDAWFSPAAAGAPNPVLTAAVVAAALLALGFRGLFFPPALAGAALLVWCAALLALTYVGYSVLSVLHQAWGARLGGDAVQRSRIVAWREGPALAGVLAASVLPSVAGLSLTTAVFAALLAAALALLSRAPRPSVAAAAQAPRTPAPPLRLPLRTPAFRRLLAVYLLNGVASAVPATLLLFFVRDRLQAESWEALFLASYFAAAALAMPLWLRGVARWGLARVWLAGMALAIATFAWALALGAGDVAAFTAVCVGSGVALGADLALPGAMLAGVIQRAGHGQRLEGAYFGWWNFCTKLNLALAAGLALPLLALLGYAPGGRSDAALAALSLAYGALPCLLKAGAAGLLYWNWRQGSLK